ncbi:hypothetical protein M406DRAFT_290169 [Cryphonectria parasitica EP155]|uniref:Uncharacterized protein n=1 Tax=Cryphonectria parasitica (strain ATCC 38755 / EP155) TaxID=660469 RepID=A0A9P5CQC0_CRYP1|nr:uncharacterized protein M406DRAFT_290169 [Cryphonectria parasitica EP155]KAF3765890.1 hypothetical protein M406DRAFT_290169 [Cryphonectria parasitica EP155]
MKELLDSDRVNYLIWSAPRADYRETAAKLQKEWRVQAPHRHFDFAPHVKNYALVDALNKGLIYQGLERDYAQSQVPEAAAAAATTGEPRGVFGPLLPQAPVNYDQLHDDEEEVLLPSSETAVGHDEKAQPRLANGNPAKRPRLGNANGLENGADTAASPMELDHHQSDGHAYPSPLEGEQAPALAPRTEGPDHATQTEKVDELESRTVYLRLANDEPNSSSSIAATPTAEVSHLRSHQNPILLHCEWNPNDPSRLAAAGTDALARVWTVSRATGPEQVADHVDPGWPSINLIDEDFPPNSRISAISWASDGKHIAVATDDDQKARIDLWDMEGNQVQHWDDFEAPIVKLRCNPYGRQTLCVSPSTTKTASNQPDGWIATLLPSASANVVERPLPGYDESDEPDADWINETDFVLCIRTKLAIFKHTGDSIIQVREFVTRANDPLTAVQYDGTLETGCIAAATANGYIDVWDVSGERRSSDAPAHDGRISVLQWQPVQGARPENERLLASGGEDGTIAIRDARMSDNKAKFEMTIDANPVLALSFTPDGAFIAGATRDRVLIWKVGEYTMPRAQWSRTSQPSRLSPKVNGTAEIEDQHCLCWDANGQRLAFGVNDLLAVINFR